MSERIAVRWWVGLAGLAVCGAAFGQPPRGRARPAAESRRAADARRGPRQDSRRARGRRPRRAVGHRVHSGHVGSARHREQRQAAHDPGGKLLPEPVWTPPSPTGNDILHGVVVHPDFATNRLVYVSYMKGDDSARRSAISRGRLDGAQARRRERDLRRRRLGKRAHGLQRAAWNSAPTRRCT